MGQQRTDLLPADALQGKQLGLSVSDSPDLSRLGLLDTHFRMALGELARTIIIAGGSLYYGGHLEIGGITNFLIEELQRYGRRDRPLKICLAWTVHRAMTEKQISEQNDALGLFGEIHFLSPDGDRLDGPVNEPVIQDSSADERAHSLSGLRSYMTTNTHARIIIGGKREGFQGVMPGILEEALFALERKQPLYIAGGFGGAALDIIRKLRPDYADWFPTPHDESTPDERLLRGLEYIEGIVSSTNWDGFDNGLNNHDNRLLAASYRPSEVAALVGKGMGQLELPS